MALTIYLSLVFLVVYLIGLAIRRWIFVRDRNRMAAESRQAAGWLRASMRCNRARSRNSG
jgi:hypothetical protein